MRFIPLSQLLAAASGALTEFMAQQYTVVIFGPGPQFKGGLANYTLSLAKAYAQMPEVKTYLFSWTHQYPSIIPRDFIDRSSKADKLDGLPISLQYLTNYNRPATWNETVTAIIATKADLVVFQWSVAVQGLPLGYIARRLKAKAPHIQIVFDCHFVIQKEQSAIDMRLSKYGLGVVDHFVAHAYKTAEELKQLFPNKTFNVTERGDILKGATTVVKLFHPVYDMFKPDPNFDVAAFRAEHGLKQHVFLFFGFIRKYKGLHHCLEAFAKLAKQRDDVSLMVVGESFWNTLDSNKLSTKIKQAIFGLVKKLLLKGGSDEKDYNPLALIDSLGIKDLVFVKNDFVANEEVYQYFQAADSILLFYEYATPSGVESMGYNFEMPMLATSVGHFPETVKPGFNGYLAKAEDTTDMARIMNQSIAEPIDRANVRKTAEAMSWDHYARTILQVLKK